MKMLNKVMKAMLILPLAGSTLADTEFEGAVPVEVALQFINTAQGGQGRLYSDILSAFPPFTVPSGFTVLASADQGYAHRVILRTSLEMEAALEALSAALQQASWQVIPDPNANRAQLGFVSSTPMPQFRQLCHDMFGTLGLSATSAGDVRYVNLTRSLIAARAGMEPSCAERLDPANQAGMMPLSMRQAEMLGQHVPRLLMPESDNPARQANISFGGGGGGSSNDWEASGTLAIDWDIAAVAEHFNTQIAEQGWQQDAEAAGEVVSTSSWKKTVDDIELVGILTILQRAENSWDLKFRVARTGTANGGIDLIGSRIIRGN